MSCPLKKEVANRRQIATPATPKRLRKGYLSIYACVEEMCSPSHLELPGFRFHPTEEELLAFYLTRAVRGEKLSFDIIGTLDLYKYDPWHLPGMAKIGDREWYFFVLRERKDGGRRPNRTTERGFWKATGSDRPVRSAIDPKRLLGFKKTLVYYQGRAPCGRKADWVMNEYRLPGSNATPKEDIVLCKIYRKATSLKEIEQRAAMQPKPTASTSTANTTTSTTNVASPSFGCDDLMMRVSGADGIMRRNEEEEVKKEVEASPSAPTTATLRCSHALPPLELQVPKQSIRWVMDDPILRSPWMELWSPYAGMFNLHGDAGAEFL